MTGHTMAAVDKYLQLTNKSVTSLKSVATTCIDDHQLSQ